MNKSTTESCTRSFSVRNARVEIKIGKARRDRYPNCTFHGHCRSQQVGGAQDSSVHLLAAEGKINGHFYPAKQGGNPL